MEAKKTVKTGRNFPNIWTASALSIIVLMLIPVAAIAALALTPTDNIWPHLLSTTLPRYLRNSLILMIGAGGLAGLTGAICAWLVVMFEFPGKRWLQWALLMPLAVPAYVGAYAMVDFLEYAGPVQSGLRDLFGWQNAQDYWFPEVRARGTAILVIAAAYYPYVYLLMRAALRDQSSAAFETARTLGAGPIRRFATIALPLGRPAFVAGVAVVMMEAVSDFGTVDYFAVQTLTTGIFSLWQQQSNLGGAAQIAALVLSIAAFLFAIEKASRRRSRTHVTSRSQRPISATPLSGGMGLLASAICALPFAVGFLLPVGVLMGHAMQAQHWFGNGLGPALKHSLITSIAAAFICTSLALILTYGTRMGGHKNLRRLLPLTAIGYAAPGAVLGLGVLIPLAKFDNWVADGILALTGYDPGLLLTGSGFAIILAYAIRFFALAQGATEGAIDRIPPSMLMAGRSLGMTPRENLRRVTLPLTKTTIASAMLLIFVDGIKELPMTLMLRPFAYNTLATRVHEKASLENITDAAPAAIMITATGLVAVIFLARSTR